MAELGCSPRQKAPELQGQLCTPPFQPKPFRLPCSSNRSPAGGLGPRFESRLQCQLAERLPLSLVFSFLVCKMRVWWVFVWVMEAAEHPMTTGITGLRQPSSSPHSPAVWRLVGACPLWASVSLVGWDLPADSSTGVEAGGAVSRRRTASDRRSLRSEPVRAAEMCPGSDRDRLFGSALQCFQCLNKLPTFEY